MEQSAIKLDMVSLPMGLREDVARHGCNTGKVHQYQWGKDARGGWLVCRAGDAGALRIASIRRLSLWESGMLDVTVKSQGSIEVNGESYAVYTWQAVNAA